MTDVKCKVETCYYWGNGDVCKADSIMVDNNTSRNARSTPMEAGNLDVNSPSGRSAQSMGTGLGRTARSASKSGRIEAADLTVGSVTRGSTRDFEAGDLTTGTLNDTKGTSKTQSDVLAHTSHETLCSTFRPKGSESRH